MKGLNANSSLIARFILFFLFFLLLASCAQNAAVDAAGRSDGAYPSLDEDDEYLEAAGAHKLVPDPLEPWNRFWFSFNDYAYEYVFRPLHKGYALIVPQPVRRGIGNFFYNLRAPVRVVNNLLQGKGKAAGAEFSSFLVNSTVGFGGFFDVVKKEREAVVKDNEDAGQTLGVWGMGEGFYIVWPLLGPSNVRDSLGMGIDFFLGGTYYLKRGILNSWEQEFALAAFRVFNDFDRLLDAYDSMKGMSVEPYSSLRDAYTQHRRLLISR